MQRTVLLEKSSHIFISIIFSWCLKYLIAILQVGRQAANFFLTIGQFVSETHYTHVSESPGKMFEKSLKSPEKFLEFDGKK